MLFICSRSDHGRRGSLTSCYQKSPHFADFSDGFHSEASVTYRHCWIEVHVDRHPSRAARADASRTRPPGGCERNPRQYRTTNRFVPTRKSYSGNDDHVARAGPRGQNPEAAAGTAQRPGVTTGSRDRWNSRRTAKAKRQVGPSATHRRRRAHPRREAGRRLRRVMSKSHGRRRSIGMPTPARPREPARARARNVRCPKNTRHE